MSRLILYYHAGSKNHGCEAIVRSTNKILDTKLILQTTAIKEDLQYGLDQIVDLKEDIAVVPKKWTLSYLMSAIDHKLTGSDYHIVKNSHKAFLSQVNPGDICMSIGGDNYCYPGVDILGYYNKMLKSKGAKTVLWGCSVEPTALCSSVVEDLKNYDLITVRESLSYEALKMAGINDNVVLCSDPAFQLDKSHMDMPKGFNKENTIGINVSPLAVDYGNLVMDNYIEMIRYILSETEFNVLLIPHVVKSSSDDRITLDHLYETFKNSDRVRLVYDHNCMELKGIISQCRIFVGARTHATIAAYSTCVPTLVAGYSIKARGIAKDIFDTDENYVIPVQALENKNNIKNALIWLMSNEKKIKSHLEKVMPEYIEKAYNAKEALNKL